MNLRAALAAKSTAPMPVPWTRSPQAYWAEDHDGGRTGIRSGGESSLKIDTEGGNETIDPGSTLYPQRVERASIETKKPIHAITSQIDVKGVSAVERASISPENQGSKIGGLSRSQGAPPSAKFPSAPPSKSGSAGAVGVNYYLLYFILDRPTPD